jgi:hypothetical protein
MRRSDDEGLEDESVERHGATLDSEIDFDDETDDDQLPLDEVEAIEVGVNLDDPEQLADEQLADEQLADEQLADEQLADEQLADE